MNFPAEAVLPRFREAGFVNYAIHDILDSGDAVYPKYFGAAHYSGAYAIMKQTDASTFRYWTGRTGYATAWAGKTLLTYDYLFNLNLNT